jgi:hypothetical protein
MQQRSSNKSAGTQTLPSYKDQMRAAQPQPPPQANASSLVVVPIANEVWPVDENSTTGGGTSAGKSKVSSGTTISCSCSSSINAWTLRILMGFLLVTAGVVLVVFFCINGKCQLVAKTSCQVVSSRFDVDEEGWSLSGDGTLFSHQTGDGGYIEGIDSVKSVSWYFKAPNKFHGDFMSSSVLRYCLRQVNTSAPSIALDSDLFVIIRGTNGTMIALDRILQLPSTNWTCYNQPLTTAGNWSVGSSVNDTTPATAKEINAVLSNITDLQILGEFQFGADRAQLDDVVLDCAVP